MFMFTASHVCFHAGTAADAYFVGVVTHCAAYYAYPLHAERGREAHMLSPPGTVSFVVCFLVDLSIKYSLNLCTCKYLNADVVAACMLCSEFLLFS